MNKEELEIVGYVVLNTSSTIRKSYIKNYIYKLKNCSVNSSEALWINTELDSGNSTTNGMHSKWFRLATLQEIEMYKQAGKPVDVITYKMEKVVKMVKCISTDHTALNNRVKLGETYKIDGNKIYFDGGGYITNYGSIVSDKCFRLLQENEVKYVKSLHESQDYELNKIYKIKEIRKDVYICESANNASKLKIYFEPSTKEAFERQNTPSVAYIKVDGKTIRIVKNIVVHEVNLTIENKIVEIPIRKKNKNKVKMEILNSPQIIEL